MPDIRRNSPSNAGRHATNFHGLRMIEQAVSLIQRLLFNRKNEGENPPNMQSAIRLQAYTYLLYTSDAADE